jgi:SAM-dependent methyltransferase
MTDYDPRIVDLYDADNPDGPDHEFYRALADDIGATSVLDLGCGTGILTVTLAQHDRTVVGVDPSPNMIDYARRREGADRVEWVLGDSRSVAAESADLALMTGNVAQHIDDDDWPRTLRDLRRALRPSGTLAFESRNPAARAWLSWSAAQPTTRQTMHGSLAEWMDVDETAPGVVRAEFHNRFTDTGHEIVQQETLYFRDRTAIEAELNAAGFTVHAVYGDWQRRPLAETSAVMIFVARAR